ncbi:MAG: PDZ domain-containing protein, partial [Acidobacteriales bacterium]|nr:PDZ domain-containing protein [Terriglobales bacterium]
MVRQDKELERLEQEFVCLRLVQMKGVDLELFQFDYDQTWAAFFLNADGAIYGRYGTRVGTKTNATTHISIASLKKAMQRALELHKGYPANKAQVADKRGGPVEFQFIDQQVSGAEKKHHHCFHCHHVTEEVRRAKYQAKRLGAADLWIYPLPENIGLKMDVDDGLRVKSVVPESPAARGDILADDELVLMNGQRLISQADVQWVL